MNDLMSDMRQTNAEKVNAEKASFRFYSELQKVIHTFDTLEIKNRLQSLLDDFRRFHQEHKEHDPAMIADVTEELQRQHAALEVKYAYLARESRAVRAERVKGLHAMTATNCKLIDKISVIRSEKHATSKRVRELNDLAMPIRIRKAREVRAEKASLAPLEAALQAAGGELAAEEARLQRIDEAAALPLINPPPVDAAA